MAAPPQLNDLLARAERGCARWNHEARGVLHEFPAWELVQVFPVPSGRCWPETWLAAGGRLLDGRMVALKNDRIWERISAWGIPYPPFDRFDNLRLEDVDADEAVRLCLFTPGQRIVLNPRSWAADQATIIAAVAMSASE